MFFRTDAAVAVNTVYADGKRAPLSPQAYFYTGPLGLLGDYAISRNEVTRNGVTAQLDHTTWEATGSYFPTGANAGFRSPVPKRPFDLREVASAPSSWWLATATHAGRGLVCTRTRAERRERPRRGVSV